MDILRQEGVVFGSMHFSLVCLFVKEIKKLWMDFDGIFRKC